MALLFYNLLLALFFPPLWLFLLWRRANGKEDSGAAWGERWGTLPETVSGDRRRPRIWVHAVSVGEVMAAAPVLRELRRRFPDAFLLLSTTTVTGREVALKQMPPADEVVYYPLDFVFAVRRALAVARPDLVLLMEWEIWPNFLTQAKKRGAKIAVLNGRISDNGLRQGEKAGLWIGPGLACVDFFAMQSDEDARRAALVGADPSRVKTSGNTKFDESVTPLTDAEHADLRIDLGLPPNSPVWVCGSTRDAPESGQPDEEMLIVHAFTVARKKVANLRLILAPRHLERAEAVAAILEAAGFSVARRSRGEKMGGEDCLLLDTFGELGRVYAVADVAFVGGSLVRRGGQSVFQPLAQGVFALFGPCMNNQRDIAALAKIEGVGAEVRNSQELGAEVVRVVLLSAEQKRNLSARARALIERNQGVSVRCVEAVAQLLGETS